MKKPLVGLTLGLFALLFMLSSAVWAVSANEHYRVDEDVQSNSSQITQGNLLPSNEGNKQTLYTPLNGGVADGQWLDFVEAWQLAADQGGAVTLQQDVMVTAADAPEGIFAQVPEDGQILLNLNGHRLVGEEVPCLIYVGARGKLTVTDGGQSGSQIVGVVYPDDSADDENEWGQIELLGGVEVVDPSVMMLADDEAHKHPMATYEDILSGTGRVQEFSHKLTSLDGQLYVDGNPVEDNKLTVSGNYYVASNIELNSAIHISGNVQVGICLNGHVIKQTQPNNRVIHIDAKTGSGAYGNRLLICDCKPNENEHIIIDPADNTTQVTIKGGLITGGDAEYTSGGSAT